MLPPFSLVIPAFNEADRIGRTLTEVLQYLNTNAPGSEVIVVDDGSTDATGEVVRRVFDAAHGTEQRLIENPTNRGKGAAVRDGLRAAAR
ncbi:MAG TPA: glycosyltransferase, partial [Chthoniobacterales bacterium]